MRIFTFALLGLGLFASTIQARPVSYPGSWTLMLRNDSQLHSAHIHYSPTAHTSLGLKLEEWDEQGFMLSAIQINHLLKRWNRPDSQTNLYMKSGIGIASFDAKVNDKWAFFTGIAADWENRRYFLSYQNRYTETRHVVDFYQQSVRFGWAPYEGDYGDLHTWLMLDIKHSPELEGSITITPLVRLFKSIHLAEIGVSDSGDFMFNYIFRY